MTRKNFTHKLFNNRIFLATISLLSAVVLWMYVTSMEGNTIQTTFRGVEVEFAGAETLRSAKKMIVLNVEPKVVDITVTGNRNVLKGLKASDLRAVVDVSTTSRTGIKQSGYTITPTSSSGISKSDISVKKQFVQTINYEVDELSSKMIEVQGEFTGSIAEGFSRDPVSITPASVKITGAKQEIDEISYGLAVVSQTEVDSTISSDVNYKLMREVGVDTYQEASYESIEMETEVVNFNMPVLMTKILKPDIKYIYGAGATEENVKIEIEEGRNEIKLAGSQELLKEINSIAVSQSIDLTSIKTSGEFTLSLIIPNDIRNLSGFNEIKVKVETIGLATKVLTVNNIEYKNLQPGYNADIVTQSLDITIRGPQEMLDRVTEANLRAVIDLEGITTLGNTTQKAEISVDGFPEVGAVLLDSYNVSVSLSAAGNGG